MSKHGAYDGGACGACEKKDCAHSGCANPLTPNHGLTVVPFCCAAGAPVAESRPWRQQRNSSRKMRSAHAALDDPSTGADAGRDPTRPLLKGGPTGLGGGGGVGGWVRGLWVGGLVWFWAIWPKVPTPPQGGGWGLGWWVGGWVGRGWVGPDSPKLTG